MRTLSLLVFVAAVCVACTSPTKVRHSPKVDFSAYDSVAFAPPKPVAGAHDAGSLHSIAGVPEVVEAAIRDELTERGFQFVERDQAPLWVSYQIGVKPRERYYGDHKRVVPGSPYYRLWDEDDDKLTTEVRGHYVTEGSLVIDLVDAQTETVVWHGYTRGVVKPTAEGRERQLREAVDEILAPFPPEARAAD